MYVIRRADYTDASAIQNLAYPEYFSKSAFNGLTYSHENALGMIKLWLSENHTLIAVDEETGEFAGVSVLVAGRTYYEEVEGDIEFFFVSDKFKGASRPLASESIRILKETYGAKVVYAASKSGINQKNDSLWSNLWSKFGFNRLGTVMIRQAA